MENIIFEIEIDGVLTEAKRIFARKGGKIIRAFRCTAGKKMGRMVAKSSDCFKKKNRKIAKAARISSRKTKFVRARKAVRTKRKSLSKRIHALNKNK
jgi:3-deoxy-D-manno-octulosonate 8-phosphate phosphatase KdsC-like HAD superfamily phosphatase